VSTTVFPLDRLEKVRQLERWHFWFVSRREMLASIASRVIRTGDTVLDIGCAGGANLSLAGRGVRAVGVDIHIEELRAGMMQGDATSLPLRDETIEVVLALDVLEHVDDDAMVGEVRRVLRTGGHLIATVPALRSLWSVRDEAAGHRRRYTRASLRALLERHGFRIDELRGFQLLLLPLVLLSRLPSRASVAARDREDAPPRWLNALFLAVNRLELRLPRLLRPPVGSSFAVVAVKD
jgi:SAM-dependent methyltransferase